LQHRCSKASQSSCYRLVNAPTSLVDDINNLQKFCAKKEKLRSSMQLSSSSSMLLFSSKSCLLLGSLAGTSRRNPSSWALLPWQWSKQNSPWISSTNWVDSLSAQLYTELAAQFMSELGRSV
jgi:hypothetical protein